jgi:hypothetical protein
MKIESTPEISTPETALETTEVSPEEGTQTPTGKLVLGKRVLRHFGVRSDVQAGTASYTHTARCR